LLLELVVGGVSSSSVRALLRTCAELVQSQMDKRNKTIIDLRSALESLNLDLVAYCCQTKVRNFFITSYITEIVFRFSPAPPIFNVDEKTCRAHGHFLDKSWQPQQYEISNIEIWGRGGDKYPNPNTTFIQRGSVKSCFQKVANFCPTSVWWHG
jgi:hypothetical protein